MKFTSRLVALSAFSLASVSSTSAQVTMVPLTSFAGDGWLAPGEIAWLSGTEASERSIVYSAASNYLFVSNRPAPPAPTPAGPPKIRILDATTGTEVNAANGGVNMTGIVNGTTVVGTGTFVISAVAVADDGVLYACNLMSPAVSDTPTGRFKIYRWDDIGSAPTVAVATGTITPGRMGDTLDAIGSGTGTILVAGEGATPNPTTTPGGYGIFTTTDGATFAGTRVVFPPPVPPATTYLPANGAFRAGITFTDSDSVLGSQGTGGFIFSSYTGTAGTFEQAKTLTNTLERPMDFLVLGGKPLLATLQTDGNTATPTATTFAMVRIYDLTNPAAPVKVAENRTCTSWLTQGGSGPGTGSVRWGKVTGNSATLYALCTNNGIQAFTVTVPPTDPPMEFTSLGLTGGQLNATWASAPGRTYRFEASPDLATWTPIASGLPAGAGATTSYNWTIPGTFTNRAQVRVVRE